LKYNSRGYLTIDSPNGTSTISSGINNKGEIVGIINGSQGVEHGFLLSNGQFQTIDYPNSQSTFASDINNQSQIVGGYIGKDGAYHGFLAKPT
jgi:probable HAF family extracellular repeat protein